MKWPWQGFVAIILAVSVGGSYGVMLILITLKGGAISASSAAVVNQLGGVLVGVLGTMVATEHITRKRPPGDDDE